MMGVERGNLDLLILALVGAAALIYEEQRIRRSAWATVIVTLAIVLKLFPMFCIAVVACFNRRTFLFAIIVAVFSLGYLAAISHYIVLIRRNVPTTFMLSYGYKSNYMHVEEMRLQGSDADAAPGWIPSDKLP
jgi:glycosyl transferase family 87